MTIDIRPMIEDVSQVMTKHITNILSGVIGEYTVYKETHDTIMGLPCVRRLHERIMELEQSGSGNTASFTTSNCATSSPNREDEIMQLQSAIAELNRYIHALESKVGMKTTMAETETKLKQEYEESVKLEIQEASDNENEEETDDTNNHESPCVISSIHKNVIITAEALLEEDKSGEPEEEAEEEPEEAEEAEEAEEEEAEEEEAEEEEAEEAEEEAEEEEPEEAEEAEEEAEEAEEEPEEAEEEAEEAEEEAHQAEVDATVEEEAEIEVSEVKIKGKTYFTTDPQNGIIYACVDDDVGDEVGVFKNGVAVFNKGKK
jgi:DNA polymerase III gamma/tau subunit